MKFREMRRTRQQLSHDRAIAILEKGTAAVLALAEEGKYPYAVPVNYVYADGKVYFHSALQGHKLELIERYEKVSLCVVDRDEVVPEEFTSYFRSVILFGRARIIRDDNEIMSALKKLGRKYSPGDEEALSAEIRRGFHHLLMVEITIDHITGKEAIELV